MYIFVYFTMTASIFLKKNLYFNDSISQKKKKSLYFNDCLNFSRKSRVVLCSIAYVVSAFSISYIYSLMNLQ
jgi:hypothetical protein